MKKGAGTTTSWRGAAAAATTASAAAPSAWREEKPPTLRARWLFGGRSGSEVPAFVPPPSTRPS